MCDCHWVREMHSEVCRDMKGGERMGMSRRAALLLSSVLAAGPSCSFKTSPSAAELI